MLVLWVADVAKCFQALNAISKNEASFVGKTNKQNVGDQRKIWIKRVLQKKKKEKKRKKYTTCLNEWSRTKYRSELIDEAL